MVAPEVDIKDEIKKKPDPEHDIPDEIVESTAISSLASIAEQPAMLSNQAYSDNAANINLSQQNAVANQQAMNEVGQAVTGKQVSLLSTVGPLESKSSLEILTGNVLAEAIADLKAIIKGFSTSPSDETSSDDTQPIPYPLEGKIYAEVPVSFVFDVEEGHEIIPEVKEDSPEIDVREK